eukprot:PhF_6_TR43493/c0_g1_i1/m.66766
MSDTTPAVMFMYIAQAVLAVLYTFIGTLMAFRAIDTRRMLLTKTGLSSSSMSLWSLLQTSPTLPVLNLLFYFAIAWHCAFRTITFPLSVALPQLWSVSIIQSFSTIIPSISFQTALYSYVWVWFSQTKVLEEHQLSETGESIAGTYCLFPMLVRLLTLRNVWMWYVAWIVVMVVDVSLYVTHTENRAYITLSFNAVNYLFLAVLFTALGESVKNAVQAARYSQSTIDSYVSHVSRVQRIFGSATAVRSIMTVVQLFDANVFAGDSGLIGIPIYYFCIELVPLAATLMSIVLYSEEENRKTATQQGCDIGGVGISFTDNEVDVTMQ